MAAAAQYLRMSTEHQRYSPEHQAAAIADYAVARGFEIVRTFRDDGISGVSMRGRAGLKALLAEVVGGEAGFDTILVYDVSRWGRFQNPDQSAHYEFLCAEAGVKVVYCAEPFENDGSTGSTILKALKRVMAAEYSRELSKKVSHAKRRLILKGFWQGGPPGYGLRRLVVTAEGVPVRVLEHGEFKAVQGHRCVLTTGPAEEVEVVRRIFNAYIDGHMSQLGIARRLNAQGVLAAGGKAWTYPRVHQVLSNPKYMGTVASLKWVSDANFRQRKTSPCEWIVVAGAAPKIISKRRFEAARERLARGAVQFSDKELLAGLRRLHLLKGAVTQKLIRADDGTPSYHMYLRRYGTLGKACQAAGVSYRTMITTPGRRGLDPAEALRRLSDLLRREGQLSYHLIKADPDTPDPRTYSKQFGSLTRAYALVGYVPMTAAERCSPIGRARLAAMRTRAVSLSQRAAPCAPGRAE